MLAARAAETAGRTDARPRVIPFCNGIDAAAVARDRRFGYAAWSALCLVACVFVALGSPRSVTSSYWTAAENWLHGQPLYNDTGTGFIYLPQFAVLAVPFAILPPLARDLVWRLLTIGVFGWGLERLASRAEQQSLRPLFGIATLVAVPLSFSSARNGQATLLIAGLMMASVASMSLGQWTRAATYLVLATAIKPLTLPLALLAAVLYPRLIGRLAIGIALIALLPSLAQSPSYVESQYVACRAMFHAAAAFANRQLFAELFGMLRVFGWPVAESVQTLVRLALAGLTLAVCLVYRRRLGELRWSVYFYALSTAYLMLFNPRTENNTYSMLGPAVGLCLAQALVVERRLGRAALLGGMALGIVGSYEIGRLFTEPARSVWLAPLATLCFGVYLLARLSAEASSQVAHPETLPLVRPQAETRRAAA